MPTTAKKLPVALRRRGAALYWIAAVAPATRARPELASERRRPARRIVEGTARGVGRRLPVAAGPKPATAVVGSARRAAAAPWGLLRAKLLGTGAYRSGVDQGSTAPVRTLALASFSLLTFLSLFLASLDESFLSLSSPFLEESLESLDLSLESLASFFSSFLTAFSSCVRRARDGARAADAKRRLPSRHRRDRRESKTPRAHLLLLLLLGPRFFRLVVLVGAFLLEVAALRVQG